MIWAQSTHAFAAVTQNQLEDITGRYAHYDVVAYQEKIGFLDMRTKIISYGLTDFVIKEGFLSQEIASVSQNTYPTCHLQHP